MTYTVGFSMCGLVIRTAVKTSCYPASLSHRDCDMKYSGNEERIPCPFSVGDRVRVCLSVEVLKQMQKDHGGWNQKMAQVGHDVLEFLNNKSIYLWKYLH